MQGDRPRRNCRDQAYWQRQQYACWSSQGDVVGGDHAVANGHVTAQDDIADDLHGRIAAGKRIVRD